MYWLGHLQRVIIYAFINYQCSTKLSAELEDKDRRVKMKEVTERQFYDWNTQTFAADWIKDFQRILIYQASLNALYFKESFLKESILSKSYITMN